MVDEKEERLFCAILQAEDEDVASTAEEASPVADALLASRVLSQLGMQPPTTPAPSPIPAPRPWYGPPRTRTALRISAAALALGLTGVVLYVTAPELVRSGLSRNDPQLSLYRLDIPGDDALLGGPAATEQPTRLTLGSTFEIDLRPARDQAGDVRARTFLIHDGEIRPWPIELSRSAQGTFRLTAPVGALPGLRVGKYEIAIAVGYASHLPADERIQELLRDGSKEPLTGWQLHRKSVEITGPR